METLIYTRKENQSVQCGICSHYCVIAPGARGRCQVRENRSGTLVSLVYPYLIASGVDPVEKKPIFHLKPGSTSYSIATVGCNLKCTFCQNAGIAQMPADNDGLIKGVHTPPARIVENALAAGCESISYTYTEPTVFLELALETARIAHDKGLYNIFVTNGFMTPEVIELAAPCLDAANVDLKAFDEAFYKEYCKARLAPVKKNLAAMKSAGILVEVTTLLIPGYNDNPDSIRALTDFIALTLGPETPWHVSRFHPCYHMTGIGPTPVELLEQAAQTGKDSGLRYVYTGNVPGLDSENTVCHSCGRLLVRRTGYQVDNFMTAQGLCPGCHTRAYGIY